LNGIPLLRGSGRRFEVAAYGFSSRRHSSFMASKSRVMDARVCGVTIQLSRRELFFIGIREDLLSIATNQEFDALTQYKFEPGSVRKNVECTFSAGRFRNLDLPPSIAASAKRSGGYVYFPLRGILNYGAEGLVFGILMVPDE